MGAFQPLRCIYAWTCNGCSQRKQHGGRPGCPACCRSSCACASVGLIARASPALSPRARRAMGGEPGGDIGADGSRSRSKTWGRRALSLLPELQTFTPPARILDKAHYSPWMGTNLASALAAGQVDTLVVTGAETDMCVLAAVLGAVDLGFRVIVVSDAVCSSSDQAHEALLNLYHDRFSQQIETAECDEVLDAWT
ncbi:isochorismatase family cysteine hydrolase [Brevundimonas sp. LF-1]|uniref:cysteine hydrolase family protein n=1 Tax=Brevundimonas sp. LF-1 TaxID=3126100 RepID=UPI0030E401A5